MSDSMRNLERVAGMALLIAALVAGAGIAFAASQSNVLTGSAAFGDWREDRPGLVRRPANTKTS
jgi:hypothetical protein